jgi:hypothetical protein
MTDIIGMYVDQSIGVRVSLDSISFTFFLSIVDICVLHHTFNTHIEAKQVKKYFLFSRFLKQ